MADPLPDPLPEEKRIHLIVGYDPDALELDDTWKRFLGSPTHDGLDQIRSHLLELEESIPWNAVDNVLWEGEREAWIRSVRRPGAAKVLGRALLSLERVILPHALSPTWRTIRPSWVDESVDAASSWRLRELLLVFEAHLRWLRFYAHDSAYTPTLQALLASADLKIVSKAKKPGIKSATAQIAGYQRALHDVLHRAQVYSYESSHEFARAALDALAGHEAFEALRALLYSELAESGVLTLDRANSREAAGAVELALPQHLRHVAWLQGGRTDRDCTPGIGDPVSLRPPLSAASAAKLAAACTKRAAGCRASSRWAIRTTGEQAAGGAAAAAGPTRRLLVFEDDANDEAVVGMLILRPHYTLADVRVMLEGELGLPAPHALFRARRLPPAAAPAAPAAGAAGGADEGGGGASGMPFLEVEHPTHPPMLPIRQSQDHKVAYTFFAHARDVLVVRRRPRSDVTQLVHAEVLLRSRPTEKLLCLDVSCGLERNPIPIYNGADELPPPLDFSYVASCVSVEAVKLLSLYDAECNQPAGCGCADGCALEGGACACVHRDGTCDRLARTQPAYGAQRALKRAYESIYECNAFCACAADCPNRVVQRGITVRLEVFRTPRAGWAVRTVDAVRAGSFICEYAGEHLPDDEAEERGIRYDQQEMSRLMDVQGDGPDALRMCVDATNFSSVARFINHSCAPNCHKQRVFADHHTRLPRVALFALCDIAPLEEISYDYGYLDVPGKTLPCFCGARNCKQKLY